MVTENFADFAGERDVALLFVPKRKLPPGGGQGAALAECLNDSAKAHPDPHLGIHWPL